MPDYGSFEEAMVPTAVGQRVRFTGYGGQVRSYHCGMEGEVIGFTRSNYPIIRCDEPPSHNPEKQVLIDRVFSARRIDDDGNFIRSTRHITQ